jgi:hypothetical protein
MRSQKYATGPLERAQCGEHGVGARQTLALFLNPHSCVTHLEEFLQFSISLSFSFAKWGSHGVTVTVVTGIGHDGDPHKMEAVFPCLQKPHPRHSLTHLLASVPAVCPALSWMLARQRWTRLSPT